MLENIVEAVDAVTIGGRVLSGPTYLCSRCLVYGDKKGHALSATISLRIHESIQNASSKLYRKRYCSYLICDAAKERGNTRCELLVFVKNSHAVRHCPVWIDVRVMGGMSSMKSLVEHKCKLQVTSHHRV